jgi:hypothetical protein
MEVTTDDEVAARYLPVPKLLAALPPELVSIAQQPIVKGHGAGGVVGNVRAVTAARRMVYRAISGEGFVPYDWQQRVAGPALGRDISAFPPLLCPQCQGPI